MLAEPNIESGADIEVRHSTWTAGQRGGAKDREPGCRAMKVADEMQCCKLYRDDREEFERRVRQHVRDLLGIE